MLITHLKLELENRTSHLMATNKFFVAASQGLINKRHIEYILNNYAYAIKYTPVCLNLAIENTPDENLKVFYSQKRIEEDKHEEWAFDDLNTLGITDRKINDKMISKSIESLFNYIISLIKKDGRYYLIYMFTAEYVLVLYGDKMLNDLNKKCSIELTQLTVISKHIMIDKTHASEDLKIISHYFNDSELSMLITIVNKLMNYIDDFYALTIDDMHNHANQ